VCPTCTGLNTGTDIGTSNRNVAGQGVAARGNVRKPGPERIPAHVRDAARVSRLRSGHEAREQKRTNPGPPDRTRRTRRTAIVLRMPPPVLNGTAANCGPPFGTKRPQVQILSPRPCFITSEALTRVGEGLSCCQYSSKVRQVQQRQRDLTCAPKGLPQPALRFARRHRHKRSHRSPTSSTRLRDAGSA
jgi:hypothetical protein